MEGLIIEIDEPDEEDTTWNNQISGRNCVVFLLDSRKDMFSGSNETCYFKQSMLCCRDAMLDIARKQRGDLIGVVLYGTKISEGKYSPDNVSILQELTVPSVEVIKKFNEMIEDDFKQLREKFGDAQDVDLTRAVNYCQILTHLCKKKLYLKTIVMMTCDDNPCGDDERAAFRARKQATELYQHQIEFEVVSFGRFDSSKLFKELILTSKGELLKDWEGKDPIMKIEGVQNQIEKFTQKFSRRLSFLSIGSDESRFVLQISLFKLFTEPRKFLTTVKNVEETSETKNVSRNEITTNILGDDDEIFLRDDIVAKVEEIEKLAACNVEPSTSAEQQKESPLSSKVNTSIQEEEDECEAKKSSELCPFLGRRWLNISKTELKKRIGADVLNKVRGFHLIGFVQTVDIPLFYNVGEPYFVMPYGRDKNNRIGFSHLLQKCRERDVSMAGWFCLTKSASPSLTFLHPLNSSKDGKGHPEGFLLSKVPFSDDLFDVDEAESAINHKPSEQQLEAAKKIVSKLTLPYNVDMFNDCEYLARMAMIEAIAMDYTDVPETEDNTDIDLDDIEKMLGELNDLFISSDSSSESSGTSTKGTKRHAANGGRNEDTKHRRQMDLIEMIRNGQANKLTVAELRDILRQEGVMSLSTLNKSRLVDIATKRFCANSQ